MININMSDCSTDVVSEASNSEIESALRDIMALVSEKYPESGLHMSLITNQVISAKEDLKSALVLNIS